MLVEIDQNYEINIWKNEPKYTEHDPKYAGKIDHNYLK
jgi:hypothetical protein